MYIKSNFPARNIVVLFLVFFVFFVGVHGQITQPTPEETIRVTTDLIQTNVVVVDKNNRFVDDLKREQFEVRVDGKPVPLEFFERIGSGQANGNAPSNAQKPTVAGSSPTLQRERKIIFFVDDLHLSLDSLGRTRSTIEHFIEDEMLPRDSVLIVSASGQIGFLQQFTDKKAVLRAALTRLKPIPNGVRDSEQPPMSEYTALRIINGDSDAISFYVEKIIEGFNSRNFSAINQNGAKEMVKNRANGIVSNLTSVSDASLGSLENLLQSLGSVSGRKLVFLASDGFYIGSKNSDSIGNPRLQRVVNMATRSSSTLYTIDARGLFSSAPDASGERPVDPKGRLERGNVNEDAYSQEGLATLADQTGGKFLKNQNYFDRWIERNLEENSNYYVLAWSPSEDAPIDKKFKRIEVGISGRPDLTVRMQRGYLANWKESDQKNETKKGADKKAAKETEKPKEAAAKKNLPIVLSLNYLDVPNVGAVLTSSVQIETGGLDYSNNQTAAIDVGGVILNAEGKQAADFKTGLNVAAQEQRQQQQSVIYNNRTPLSPGIYQVRVGAREAKSGQTGTATAWIEIPDLTKKQLTLSDLLLGVKTLSKSDKPEDTQVQFSVDHKFPRPMNLDFTAFIYNAAKNASGEMNLATKIEIFNAQGRAIVNTQMRPLSTKGIDDLARIPVTGAIRQQTTAPGTYLLRVTVNDSVANTSVVRQIVFTVE